MALTKKATPATAATKAAPVKAATSKAPAGGIVAYCVKTKEKNVPMLDAVVDVQSGRYIAKGLDASGNKLTAIMSAVNAAAQVKAGNAKKGIGWA